MRPTAFALVSCCLLLLVSASAFFINDYSKSGNIFYLAGGRPEMGDINNLRNFAVAVQNSRLIGP